MDTYYLALIAAAIALLLLIETEYFSLKKEIRRVSDRNAKLDNGFESMTDWMTSMAENVARLDSEQERSQEQIAKLDSEQEKSYEKLAWLETEYEQKMFEKVEAEKDAAREFERSQELFNEGLRSITDFTGGLPQRGNR